MAVKTRERYEPNRLGSHAPRILALLVPGVVMILLSYELPWAARYPEAWVVPITGWIDSAMGWLIHSFDLGLFTFQEFTRAIAWSLTWPLKWAEALLATGFGDGVVSPLPWITIVAFAAILGHFINGWRMAALAGGCTAYLAVFGQWDSSMRTMATVLVCVPLATGIGLALGIAAARSLWIERIVTPLMDLMQSIPHYAYFVPVVFFFGIGLAPGAIATIIFATPPMVRCTLLGIKRVPAEVQEAALMAGCTPNQLLRKVQLPIARPLIMVGVNQAIMQTLGMVVIASLIGVKGLGYDLLFSLQNLRLGKALEQGVAIVVIAIALDRLSYSYATEQPWFRKLGQKGLRRHAHGLIAATVLIGFGILALMVPSLAQYPNTWSITTAPAWDGLIRWFTDSVYDQVALLRTWLVLYVFLPVKLAYLWLPWPLVIFALAWVAFGLGGLRLAALVTGLLASILLSGFWEKTVLTAYLVTISVALCIMIGIPIGIAAARNQKVARAVKLWCDVFQTFPSFIYLIPVVMLFKVGDVAAVMAVVVWAVIPMIRYTLLGLQGVSHDVIEAAVSCGCTSRQILWRVQLPLAVPEIMLGVNQTIMFALFMVIIAALIGTQDLGREIMHALTYSDIGKGIMAGLCIAFIGIIADRLIGGWSSRRREALGLIGST